MTAPATRRRVPVPSRRPPFGGGRALAALAVVLGGAMAPAARGGPLASAPRSAVVRAVPSHEPRWVSLRERFTEARAARRVARWRGSLDGIVAALRSEADAETSYLDALASWLADGARPAAREGTLRVATLDALEAGRTALGHALLEGPLRDDATLTPLRAHEMGARGAPDSGLALLRWPPDRRPARSATRASMRAATPAESDEAALLVANALADSTGNRRAARAALWGLLAGDPSPAARREGRLRLARELLGASMPRLALGVIAPEEETGGDAALLAADARAGERDTLAAVVRLVGLATPRGLPTADRHAMAVRASDWLRGARVDSIAEDAWIALAGVLGDLGEPSRGLALLDARRRAAPDSTSGLTREETRASLLLRAKRNDDAAAAYGRLLARSGPPPADRARYALGLGRAQRGAGRFAAMDSAFVLAATLDPGGASGGVAAWERAREWEDRKTPREAAAIYAWAKPLVTNRTLAGGVRVHGGLCWIRAGVPDSARAFLAAPGAPTGEAQFWLGRVALAQGDSVAARAAFHEAWTLAPWSYEGLRAAETLRDAGFWPADSLPFRAERPDPVKAGTGLESPLRVRLLEAVDLLPLALQSLRDCARGDTRDDRVCLDALEEHGVFRAAPPSSNGVDRDRWQYPPAYALEVFGAARSDTVDPAFLWAVMRQESAYDRAVRSRAGALGLLQLLPSTASKWAGHAVTGDSLVHADVNVRLGARYLRALAAELKDPRAVSAAYNAGEDAVRRWLRDRSRIDDEWVELIPYRETRDYVKQVYANWRRYEALYEAGDAPPAP